MKIQGDDVPSSAKGLFTLGPRTEEAVRAFFRPHQGMLFDESELGGLESHPGEDFGQLAQSIVNSSWEDEAAAELILGLSERKIMGCNLNCVLIGRWVVHHSNDVQSVFQCMDVEPPKEIEIIRVLSRVGSQKIVYLASWRLTERKVVLKRMIRSDGTAERELESFPINLSHPNIIETYRLHNSRGELFLVERRLTEVLHDGWMARGIHEGSNLLYDIAAALKFLHDHDRVHGDIKPDNIGKEAGEYILLDFGICRTIREFVEETLATGSLRTRAPELLIGRRYVDPPKVDVWALGATIFAVYSGRFPLIDEGEKVPRVSVSEERLEFESKLRKRALEEWDQWVNFEKVPERLRNIVKAMLEREPAERISSSDLLETVKSELSVFVRKGRDKAARSAHFSPLYELGQIEHFLTSIRPIIIPGHKKMELRARLSDLSGTAGFSLADRDRVDKLISLLEEG